MAIGDNCIYCVSNAKGITMPKILGYDCVDILKKSLQLLFDFLRFMCYTIHNKKRWSGNIENPGFSVVCIKVQ